MLLHLLSKYSLSVPVCLSRSYNLCLSDTFLRTLCNNINFICYRLNSIVSNHRLCQHLFVTFSLCLFVFSVCVYQNSSYFYIFQSFINNSASIPFTPYWFKRLFLIVCVCDGYLSSFRNTCISPFADSHHNELKVS